MITEEYVSFETAKLLKEKGFDGECSRFYMPSGHGRWKYEHYHDFDKSDRIDCPIQQMAMRWLREVHYLFISIFTFDYQFDSYGWMFLIKPLRYVEGVGWCWNSDCVQEKKWSNDKVYKIYEDAVDAAIKYCLENLI